VSVAYYDFFALKQLPLSALMVLDASLAHLGVTQFHPGKLGEGVSYWNDAFFFTNALKIGNPPTQSCSVNAVLFIKCFAVFKGFMVRLA